MIRAGMLVAGALLVLYVVLVLALAVGPEEEGDATRADGRCVAEAMTSSKTLKDCEVEKYIREE